MLRVLFVTSQLTYMPRNYQDLFTSFFKHSTVEVVGLILLKNLNLQLLRSIIALRFLGAKKIQQTLIKNILSLRRPSRQTLFREKCHEVVTFCSMNSPDAIKWTRTKDVDIIINVRTRCIYREEILNLPKLGCINIHHGILPRYRGTMCDLYALAENRAAGFSIHKMTKKIDDGPIFRISEVSNGQHNDYLEYLEIGAKIEGRVLADLMNEIDLLGSLPIGIPNRSNDIIFTKNPTRPQVKLFKQRGIVL